MISKALRPAGQRSKHLKRVSHHLLGEVQNLSTGDDKEIEGEAIDKEVSEEIVANSGKEKKARKHGKEKKGGKGKKSQKHSKDGKTGKEKKSQKSGKKDKATSAKAVKPAKKEKIAVAKEDTAAKPAAVAAAREKPAKPRPVHLALVPTPPEVAKAEPAPAADTLPAAERELQAEPPAAPQAKAVAAARTGKPATPRSRRHVAVHLILVAALITLFALWGYRYWNKAQDVTETASADADTPGQAPQDHEPAPTVSKAETAAGSLATGSEEQKATESLATGPEEQEATESLATGPEEQEAIESLATGPEEQEATESLATGPEEQKAPESLATGSEEQKATESLAAGSEEQKATESLAAGSEEQKATESLVPTPLTSGQSSPSQVAATHASKPESTAAKPPVVEKPFVPPPRPRFRPPAYGQQPPYHLWQRAPYPGNTSAPPFRQPPPARFYRGERPVPAGASR